MALQVIHDLKTGFSGNYWRITEYYSNVEANRSECILSLYKDSDSRDSGKDPATAIKAVFSGADNPLVESELSKDQNTAVKLLYNKIKTKTLEKVDFTQALDV